MNEHPAVEGTHAHTMLPRALMVAGALISLGLSALLLHHSYWPAGDGLDRSGGQIGRDFINAWMAPYLAMHGQEKTLLDLHAYSAAASARFGQTLPNCYWSYPPLALLLYLPFSPLPYSAGLALWTVLGLAAAAFALRAYCSNSRAAWALAALAPATIINLLSGQNGFWTGALLIGGLMSIRKYPAGAGIAVGLLTFKPQLGLILPFALIALRAWRAIAFSVATVIVLAATTSAIFGLQVWADYWSRTTPFEMGFLYHFQGMYAAMMLSPFAGLRRLGLPYFNALAMQIVISLVFVVFTMRAIRGTDDLRRQVFVIASALPLVTPYIFNYDLVGLSIPLVGAMAQGWKGRQVWQIPLYLLAWLMPLAGVCMVLSGYDKGQALAPLAYAGIFICAIRKPTDA